MASIRKRENGSYCIRVYVGTHEGKTKCVSTTYNPPSNMPFRKKEEDLKRFAKLFETMVRSGQFVPGTRIIENDTDLMNMTLQTFVDKYYLTKIEKKMSPYTVRFYRTVIEQFIIPSFGYIRLTDIRKKDLQQFIDYMAENSEARIDKKGEFLSVPTIKRYATIFRSIMAYAYNMEYISDNPFNHGAVEYPNDNRNRHREIMEEKAYGLTELKDFLAALNGESPLVHALLLTSVVTGVRRGELVALKWEDFDFDLGCVYIDKSAYKLKGQKQKLKSPKSDNGYRKVFLVSILKTHCSHGRKNRINIVK